MKAGFLPPRKTFADFAIKESFEEIIERIGSEQVVLDPLAIKGQMTMIYGPANSGKTLLVLKLLEEFRCRSLTSTQMTTPEE